MGRHRRGGGLCLLQLTNPARTNPPVVHDLAAGNPPPAEVTALLHAACYDCHSYETKWTWYSAYRARFAG